MRAGFSVNRNKKVNNIMKTFMLTVLTSLVFCTASAEVVVTVFDGEEAYKNRPAAANLGESAIFFYQNGKWVSAAVEGEPVYVLRAFTVPDSHNREGEPIGIFLLHWKDQITKHTIILDKKPGHPTVLLRMSFTPNAGEHTLVFASLWDEIKDSRPLVVNPKKAK